MEGRGRGYLRHPRAQISRPGMLPYSFPEFSCWYHRTSRVVSGVFQKSEWRIAQRSRRGERGSGRCCDNRGRRLPRIPGGSAQTRMRTANGTRSAMRNGQGFGAGSRRPDRYRNGLCWNLVTRPAGIGSCCRILSCNGPASPSIATLGKGTRGSAIGARRAWPPEHR
jgi:hypothetical protein